MPNNDALTPEETKLVEEFHQRCDEAHQATKAFEEEVKYNPDKSLTVLFRATIKGETLLHFMWLRHMLVSTGVITPSTLSAKVIELGVRETHRSTAQGTLASVLVTNDLLDCLPPELRKTVSVYLARKSFQELKLAEEEAVKESLNGLHKGTTGSAKQNGEGVA